MSNQAKTTLVLGGTRKTGRRIVRRLTARGVPVRVGSRSGEPRFDWDDRATWGPALEDVDAAYVSFYPDLAVPGTADTIAALARTAAERGVRRLVLLSGRGEEEAERSERVVQASGLEWTVLRSSWFSQNFSESFMVDGIVAGELALPADGVREPFVDAEDIADIAVAALTEPRHDGELYELTGPRALTFAEAVAEIAAATGGELRFVPVAIEEYAAALAQHGLPPEEIALIAYLFGEVLDGRNSEPAYGVQRALGRPAREFRDYARATAATGVWARR